MADHIQQDVAPKIDQVTDLVRHALRKATSDGRLTPKKLQAVNERGGAFQQLVLETVYKVASMPRMVDTSYLQPVKTIQMSAITLHGYEFGDMQDGIEISSLSEAFELLLSNGEKALQATAQNLRVHRLRTPVASSDFFNMLGGKGQVETSPIHLWELLKKQGEGEAGDLASQCGEGNFFFMEDADGTVLLINCYMSSNGWCISREYLEDREPWPEGRLVFTA